MGEISVKTGNNARNGGKNSLNRLIRCVCGKKIGPDPRNFNQRVSLGRNDLLIRTFPSFLRFTTIHPQFDLYLITNGIRNRPQDKGGIEYFDIPDGSVSLGFRIRSTYESESLLPIKSDGEFVFSELVVYQKNKDDLP
ncbi:hypothetical protein KRA60_004691, partial [Salmonella enterica subsp. enterica serovar Kentucky]|nr:hypothetical protein [Salmonella enterica subsp. enterica serovar Kentucky]